ncbi:RNA polymerase sigma factor [Breoghania sp. L-A4]|uniref:RNA polymerase sigma factor n=1 Tax=Breoghania sp. L-A4 TaxID=2304600 RepID=UPI000E35ACFE|nr:RNA polymerase sigma factor [Breoghania sp. L-A4]AXS41578.1 RNA polymerase sigma factor [Breoghania sp. L-A4]
MAFAETSSAQPLSTDLDEATTAARTRASRTEGAMAAASDDELLHRIGLDDEQAFRTLTERHIDRGYAVALRILRSPADAEDVVQDAFLQVWTKRGRWQPGKAQFSTWLYRVVTNRCIDLLRKPRTETIELLPEIGDGRSDQMQTLLRHEASALLTAAIAKLPDQQRIALILSYTENMSNTDIAAVMETSVYAVESLLKRGRQKLRHILRNAQVDVLSLLTDD